MNRTILAVLAAVFFLATIPMAQGQTVPDAGTSAGSSVGPAGRIAARPIVIGAGVFLAAMIILRHSSNIKRLLAGTEPKFGG